MFDVGGFDVEGFILVGGASSRMGTNKAQLRFGGQTAVERIANELGAITPRISLVGSRIEGPASGLKVVSDIHARWGALGGIHAALSSCEAAWAMIIACDLPFVSRDLLSRLIELAHSG